MCVCWELGLLRIWSLRGLTLATASSHLSDQAESCRGLREAWGLCGQVTPGNLENSSSGLLQSKAGEGSEEFA